MTTLSFALHKKQQEVYDSPARFKVCAAGRRAGKTFFAAVMLIIKALEGQNEHGDLLGPQNAVWYVAPTYQQAKDILWIQLKELARPLSPTIREKDLTMIMPNGRSIVLKGSDNEDTLRGVSLSYVVLDEYADMKPGVFDLILRPALADKRGGALFIGTPKGKNHFYDLWMEADNPINDDMEAFHFCSLDNPMIRPEEIEAARRVMSREAFKQEFEASFQATGGGIFREDEVLYVDERPPEGAGAIYIAVDPAGFRDVGGLSKSKAARLDETAIAVVEVREDGWLVLDMIHGRWGVRQTALQIIRACQKYRPAACGIEGGSLKNAVMPYLEDEMRRLNIYPNVVELKHGGQKKTDRIVWSLQGRFQHGRIKLVRGPWNETLVNQLLDFPNPLAHDDLPDALAYIDQIATTIYGGGLVEYTDFEPLDDIAGY